MSEISSGEREVVGIQESFAPKQENITMAQRMVSACSGALLTSLIVTPFDVIRIRIQQQEIMPKDEICCQHQVPTEIRSHIVKGPLKVTESTLEAVAKTPELFWINKSYCEPAANCSKITSTYQGFVSITKNEGLPTLWRGLSLTLFMAVPSNIVYFTGYEYIRDHSPIGGHPLNPLVCGALARILAASIVSPIELLKTRLQSIPSLKREVGEVPVKVLSNLLKDLWTTVRKNGVGVLFTGLQITLWRDVPFSGIYWLSYEYFKSRSAKVLSTDFGQYFPTPRTLHLNEDWRVFGSSFFSGSISGFLAALFTNPFDVGKTRLQITSQENQGVQKHKSMFKFLINILEKEGLGALYAGFVPRAMKVVPACAIMISSYEIGKRLFLNDNQKAPA